MQEPVGGVGVGLPAPQDGQAVREDGAGDFPRRGRVADETDGQTMHQGIVGGEKSGDLLAVL